MNNVIIESICECYGLDKLIESPKRVYGGLIHKMWYFKDSNGAYAVKQLTEDINLTNQNIIDNYNLTEKIASIFIQKEIPAVSAIECLDNYLSIIEGRGFLVYPWILAKSLDKDAISESQALQIGRILAQMHQINLKIPEILAPQFDTHDNDKILALAKYTIESECPFSEVLKDQLSELITANEAYHQAIPILKQQLVVSHGDLDQKNVLWDELNNPILIDWESARMLNPTYEIVNACLDWSGITTEFNSKLFIKMLEAYKKAGGIIDPLSFEASFYGVLGNWINWLVYNMERSSSKAVSEQKIIGVEQVTQVLPTISRLNALIPELLKT